MESRVNYGPWANHRNSPVRNRIFYIEGDGPDGTGAIVNNVENGDYGYHLNKIEMTGDATIGGISRIDFRGSRNYGINGNGHELTIKNTSMLVLAGSSTFIKNCSNIIVDGGVLQPCNPCVLDVSGHIILKNGGVFAAWDTQTFDVPIIVGEGGGVFRSDNGKPFHMNGDVEIFDGSVMTVGICTVTMSSLTLNQGATVEISDASANLSVTGEFVNNGTLKLSNGTVSFPDGGSFGGTLFFEGGKVVSSLAGFTGTMVVDVSKLSEPLDVEGRGWFTLAYGKEVLVDTGSRDLQFGDRLLSWTSLPLGVRFRLVGDFPGVLRKDANGVVYGNYPGLKLIVR